MRKSLTSLLITFPLLTWAVAPTPDTVLNGAFVLDGAGSILDATTLPSLTGYFMNSGSLDLSNITLQNFHTFGGPGSGGGAGLGGTLFVRTGVAVTLDSVNFIGSNVTGGLGGFSDLGGVLNGLLTPTSNGVDGNDGTDAFPTSAFTNNGNGGPGRNGTPGQLAVDGFGGNGGDGGNGSLGLPTSSQQVKAIVDQSLSIVKTVQDAIDDGVLTALIITMEPLIAAALALGEANLAIIYAPGVAAVQEAFVAAFITLDEFLSANVTAFDVAKLAAQTALLIATQVTAYEVTGTSGRGGDGGAGSIGGDGSYGFGGGRGGDGGDGGDATPVSIAKGGNGGPGGKGGDGGFGGGGGRGGDDGQTGVNGIFAPTVNGRLIYPASFGGFGGFGAGVGSQGNTLTGGGVNGSRGGGGAGYGGAVFLSDGSTLTISGNSTFCGNFAQGGSSLNNGIAGNGLGNDLFMMTGSTVTLNPGLGNTIRFAGSIADDSTTTLDVFDNAAGFGAGLTVQSGLVIFSGTNTYSGQTLVTGGVLQATDGIGINPASNIDLSGGIFEGSGSMTRYLGDQPNRLQFAPGVSSGFSAAGADLFVNLQCGATLIFGTTPFFLSSGVPFIFGSTSATANVIFANNLDLAGVNQTILATANPDNTFRVIFTGVISDGSLTVGDGTHTGIVELAGANTYAGPTQLSGGTLVLSGSLASTSVTINAGTTFEDVNSGLANGTALVVNGTFILDADDTINDLTGSGTINLNGGTLTLNSGNFSGVITGTNPNDGIIKISVLNLTLSGASTYIGPTQVLGGTLTLTGSLLSQTISIAPGAVLDDVNGGLDSNAMVTVDGTLLLGATETIGSLFGTGNVSLDFASLTVGSGDFSGTISGVNPAFGLTKDTTGTLILSGVNTYVGPTDVLAGHLVLQGLGSLASSPVTIFPGAFIDDLNGGLSPTSTIVVNGTLNLGADQFIGTLLGASTGLINLNAGNLNVNDGNFAGVIAGTDPFFGLIKLSPGVLTLSGDSTYVGTTDIVAGTLNLDGSLVSPTINVGPAGTLNDNNGGLSTLATLTNDGIVNLPTDDTIFALINTGTINGVGTLTALTYELDNGSVINANLGTGIITSNGTVQLNGTSSASPIHIVSGTFTTGPLGSRLLLFPDVNIDIGASLVLGGNEAIGGLFGSGGVNMQGNIFSVNNGNFAGVISGTASSQFIKTSTGTLTLSGNNTYLGSTLVNQGTLVLQGTLLSPFIHIATGAILEDVNGGFLSPTLVVEVDGTLNLDVAETIPTLLGSSTGVVNLFGGNLTVNNGSFAGNIASASPLFGLIKATPGILTLSGVSTYTGPTQINDGTLILDGRLASLTVNVAPGATLDDNGGPGGGLAVGATLTNDGIVNLSADDTILTLVNTGILNGIGTLTASTYFLNNGSVINANLGTGTLNSNGIVQLNGTSSADPINVQTGVLTLGAPGGRLLLMPDVTIDAPAELVFTGPEVIDDLSDGPLGGGTLALQSYGITLNSGVFSGVISGNPFSSLTKNTGGTLVLSGHNTYLGTTQVNAGTMTLAAPNGALESEVINIAVGATFNDLTGGLSGLAALTNNGSFVLGADDHVASVVNSGSISGIGFTLTAATYLLQNGSNVSANLGTGVLTTTGNVTLSGTSAAGIVNISPASTLNLVGNQRLSSGATVNVNGTLNAATFNQTINILNGTGGTVIANNFQVNNGGTFTGQINTASFTAAGGILNLNNPTVLTSPLLTLDTGATLSLDGPGSSATTNTVTLNNNSDLSISGGAIVTNSGNTTIAPNALLNVVTGSQYINLPGNIIISANGNINLDATSIIKANQIITGVNSTITVPNSAGLVYNLLTGFGIVNSLGNTFVNLTTVSGDMIFLDNFTNLGTLSPGFSPGLITIGGNYVEGGHLALDIVNTTAITGYDQVRVGGTATLLPSSEFDVIIDGSALVAGNFFQVIANSVGGIHPVGGVLGTLSVTVNGAPVTPATLIFDAGTGRLIVTGIPPGPPGPGPGPGPGPKPVPNPLFHIGCTPNQNRVAKAVFTAALMGKSQINTNTVAGKLAQGILISDHCKALALFSPKYYGALSDYAIMGDRALASRVWDSVTTFSALPDVCCPKLSAFSGVLHSEANHLHQSNLRRNDIYVGIDFANCHGFSIGAAATDSKGNIHSHLGKSKAEGNAGIFYVRKNLGAYFMLFGVFSGSFQDNHMHRPTLFGHAKAHTKTKSYTTNLGLKYKGWQSSRFAFAPRMNVVYSHAQVNGFTEKGEIDALHDSGYNARFLTGEIGFSSLYFGSFLNRHFDIEATVGLEQPFMYHKGTMKMYVIDDPAIAYSVLLAQTAKTRLSGGINFGYNIFKAVTLFGSYEVITGGHWNHIANAGIRICL